MHSWMAKSMRMITGQTNLLGNIIPEYTIKIKTNVKVKNHTKDRHLFCICIILNYEE